MDSIEHGPAEEFVVLVDQRDRSLGRMEKLEAHRRGVLHRAFSIFVFDDGGRLLLQRRARSKYHSGGLWANTCCGHPRPSESTTAAGERRLQEEMGFWCRLRREGSFVYRAQLGDGLAEHELDHVLVGTFNGVPRPDPREVEAWKWVTVDEVSAEFARAPEQFAVWFPEALSIAQ